jgi:hypothetical protein
MNEAFSQRKVLLARMVPILVLILVILDLTDFFSSPRERQLLMQDILARPGGPMTFRFILQPVMAASAALRDGIKDAQAGRSPYFWTVLTKQGERSGRLYEGLLSTSQIILLALIMDTVYQFIVLKTFYSGQAVIVALALAFLPYLLLRGPITRIARRWYGNMPIGNDPINKEI